VSKRPLNETLYAILQSKFGKVKVLNQGQPFRCRKEVLPGKQIAIHKLQGGEEYGVNCPVCGDKRGRLYINHMFGSSVYAVRQDELFHCYNEAASCRKELEEILEDIIYNPNLESVQVEDLPELTLEQIIVESATKHAQLNPKHVTRLDRLEPTHPAVMYMQERGFDPVKLAKVWGCSYAADPNRKLTNAYRRIIIPLIYDGIVVGYQARAIPGHTRKQTPKYWTASGCKKSYFLGGYDYAIRGEALVLVEGPTKKWRIGPPAVDILGSSLSSHQVDRIMEGWGKKSGPIVFVSDPGFEETWLDNARKLVPCIDDVTRIVNVNPPIDAGDMSTEDIRRLIVEGCASQGHRIVFDAVH
jgi:hypothetical protein